MPERDDAETLLSLTADIVAAHLANNRVGVAEVPGLIREIHAALATLGEPAPAAEVEAQKPAVPIRSSIKPDYLVCLEDGKQLTMLKRYLMRTYGMTPGDYRAKWKLPPDYPMVAPNYAEKRRELANSIGLGRKRPAPEPEPVPQPSPPAAKRGRKPKAAEAA
ncbi:MAG: mucR3 [Sphingomonas bacterium]|jgi:predicted transcriptional regulator|nr:mucR3 [Sphingomonas bacterium]MDB5682700.1 mucR3 [Sphingomonas bacterium]